MFGGIGFIGLLTSTITDFFTKETSEAVQTTDSEDQQTLQQLLVKVETLTQKIDQLQTEVHQLKGGNAKKKDHH